MHLPFRLLLAAAVVAGSIAAPVAFAADTGPSGATVVDQCYSTIGSGTAQVNNRTPQDKACRTVLQLDRDAGAYCRTPLYDVPPATTPESCAVVDGHTVSEAQVAAYEQSWTHRALTLQRQLTESAPLFEEQLLHTHNSYNSNAWQVPTDGSAPSYYPTLTNQDANQLYSITDQLRMDVRVLELDVHWVPSPYGNLQTGGYWVTLCHGDSEDPTGTGTHVHVGCTDDRPFQDGLAEIVRWLHANPHEFLIIYLENQLDGNVQGHDVAASIIQQQLGSLVYRPASTGCTNVDYNLSADQVLASGHQVVLVGNCGPGAWDSWVFSRGPLWDEHGDPAHYTTADCQADMAAREHHTSFRRFFEESVYVEAMMDADQSVSAATVSRMTACGVNIIGLDQLEPTDPRLAASVWSWAPNEPSATGGTCAYQGSDGRFHTGQCTQSRHFACVDANGDFHETAITGPEWVGDQVCKAQFPGSTYDVPRNGYRNAQLAASKAGAADQVWLAYSSAGGGWAPGATRPPA